MIRDEITRKITEALKSRDKVRLSTLRLLSSALNYEFIEKQRQLTEEEEITVVKREIKKRKEAIEVYSRVGQKERAEIEKKELAVLKEFVPEEVSQEEIEFIINNAIDRIGRSPSNFGLIMKEVMGSLGSKADGALVASLVKNKLS